MNLHLSSLNRYSSQLKSREKDYFTLNSGLDQIVEESNTLKKQLGQISKSFKANPLRKVNPDPLDVQLLKGRSSSQSIEEEMKIPPLEEVSDSLSSVSSDAEENYHLALSN